MATGYSIASLVEEVETKESIVNVDSKDATTLASAKSYTDSENAAQDTINSGNDAENVKLTGDQSIAGIKTFNSPTTYFNGDLRVKSQAGVSDADIYFNTTDNARAGLVYLHDETGNMRVTAGAEAWSFELASGCLTSQGTPTEPSHLTTKTYVDSANATQDATIALKETIVNVDSKDATTLASANSYTDSENAAQDTINSGNDAENVKLAGTQTITGAKTFTGDIHMKQNAASDLDIWFNIDDGVNTPKQGILYLHHVDGSMAIQTGTGLTRFYQDGNVSTTATAPTSTAHLTRRDYVDAGDASTLSSANSHTNSLDAENVKLTGTQTITGTKTFTGRVDLEDAIISTTTGDADLYFSSNGKTGLIYLYSTSGSMAYRNSLGSAYQFIHDADNGYIYAVDFVASSDRRLKSNIKPIESSLDKVNTLTGYSYFKGKSDENGLIAQEVQEVLPESVQEGEDGMLGVNYNGVIALLVNSVKELTEQNKALLERVEALEGK